MKISAIVLTKDEEKNIERCLKSIEFCNEIIIIDDYSEDKTIEIVHKVCKVSKVYKVIQRKLNGDFSSQRNFGMEKARFDWILFVDADEEVTSDLREEIKSLVILSEGSESKDSITNTPNNSYHIKRRDLFWGREMRNGETRKLRNYGIIRLVKKNSGRWIGKVHEEFKVDGPVGRLNNYLDHYPHQTLKKFIEDVNFYSGLRAVELYQLGTKFNIFQLIFFPLSKFILVYFIYLGFLDGPAGFVYAFLMSFHSFLVRAKLYQLEAERR